MLIKTKIFNLFRLIFKVPVLEKFLLCFTIEQSSQFFFSKLVPNNYQYKTKTWRRFSRNGITMEVDISDYVGHYIYFGFYDESFQSLLSLVSEGNFILDIGANIGSTSIHLSKRVGKIGKIFSFEPDSYNYVQLCKNIKLNSYDNAESFNIGLGNESSRFKLFVDTPSNRGGNRILSEELGKGREYCLVQINKLDDWVREQNINQINLIKIDVEGYELKVLDGAKEILKKFKPKLFIELDDNNLKEQGQSGKELISFLEQKGYNIIHSVNMKNISSSFDFTNCHFDIICQ